MNEFKGWQVLWASFFTAMLIAGATIYSFGLFITPLEAEFGLSREESNLSIFAVLYVSIAFWAVTIGRIFERVSTRKLCIAGAIAFAIGFCMIAAAPSPLFLSLAIFFPLGFALTAAGPFFANAIVTRWFSKKRGRALGIVTVATSAGGFAVVPLFAVLMEQFGWRIAALIAAFSISALVALTAYKFVIDRPSDIDQHPDGETMKADAPDTASAEQSNFVKRPEFWFIAFGAGLLLGSDQALLASLIPYGQERGFSTEHASLLLTAMTGSAIAGKLLVGWLAERYDKRLLFSSVCSANIIFLAAALMSPPYWQLLVVCLIVGLAIGGVYPVWTTLTAEHFGATGFAKVIGAMNLITVPLIIVSIQIAGRTRDDTGDYNLAFKIFIAQVVLSALIIWCLRMKDRTSPQAADQN